MDSIINYIKATTAYGGDDYFKFSRYYTAENMLSFEEWLTKQAKANGITLYRGYCFEESYWNDCSLYFDGDGIITEDQLTAALDLPAFTESLIRASNYMNEFGNSIGDYGDQKVLFEIHTCGKYFVDISCHSHYKSEREYRCVRGTKLHVDSIKNKGSFIHITCTEV